MLFSPEELQRRIDEASRNPGVTAQLDQQQAALDANRNVGISWALLLLLAADRGNESAKVMALHYMRLFLVSLGEDEITALTSFLLTDVMMRIVTTEYGGDVSATVAEMIGDHMVVFEKFVATGGKSCPSCGANEGWAEHGCDDDGRVEE